MGIREMPEEETFQTVESAAFSGLCTLPLQLNLNCNSFTGLHFPLILFLFKIFIWEFSLKMRIKVHPVAKLVAFSIVYFLQFSASIMFGAGVKTQASYDSTCLLFIEDYRLAGGQYDFNARSLVNTFSTLY